MGPSPPTRARGPGSPRPSPACCQARCHCPFLAPSSPETQSVLCLSVHSAARSHQLVCVPSHPGAPAAALHTKETGARAASPPRAPERPQHSPGASGGAGTREDPSARPPRAPAPAPTSAVRGSGTARPRGRAGQPRPTALCRGVSSHPPAKAAPGRARSGRHPDGQRGGGDVPAAPPPPPPLAGLQSPAGRPARQRRVTCAPRPSPRRSRAPLPRAAAAAAAGAPPPSASQWVSDAPGPSAKPGSPIAIAFIWPPQSNQAPPRLAGREAGFRPITGPAGLGGAEPAPRRGARGTRPGRAGGACARARAGAEGRGRRVEAPRRFFVLSLNARRLSGRRRAGGQASRRGRGASGARAAGGGQAGWGGGNRPEGGTARSRRLAGTAAPEFPGRRGGAGPKAKFEPVQNSGW